MQQEKGVKKRKDFVVFILSHGRHNNVKTVSALKESGYTGEWLIVLDNEDDTIKDYQDLYGEERVVVFDKLKKSQEIDTCDLASRDRNSVLYARNACFDIAKQRGYRYFLQLDDDYDIFRSREVIDGKFTSIYVRDMNSVISEYIQFLDATKAYTIAFAQTGDFIGGSGCHLMTKKIKRKAMNAFFCTTERPFQFIGRVNEDVNTYVLEGSRGNLFLTPCDMTLNQAETQKQKGGMTELYLKNGTYIKSFYTVITSPSSVKIYEMGDKHKRIHHKVNWNNAVPCIIREEYKKV